MSEESKNINEDENIKESDINKKNHRQPRRGHNKWEYITIIIVIGLILLFFGYYLIYPYYFEEEEPEPIPLVYEITSDDDFKKYPNIKGTGTENDPYILANIAFYQRIETRNNEKVAINQHDLLNECYSAFSDFDILWFKSVFCISHFHYCQFSSIHSRI